MKKLNKFFAVLVALAMMATLCVSMAFAEPATADAAKGEYAKLDSSYLVKYFKIPDGVTVDQQAFTFKVAPKSESVTHEGNVTDIPSPTGAAADKSWTVTIPANKFAATTLEGDGQSTYANVKLSEVFAGITWPHAGVFTYDVTEEGTDTDTLDYSDEKYAVNIYVVWDTTTKSYKVDGATVQKYENQNVKDGKTNITIQVPVTDKDEDGKVDVDETTKEINVDGFTFTNLYTKEKGVDPEEKPDGKTTKGAINLTKEVLGKTNDATEFDFTLDLKAATGHENDKGITYTLTKKAGTQTQGTFDFTAGVAQIENIKLADGDAFVINELPAGTYWTVTENLTQDANSKYTPKYAVTAWDADAATPAMATTELIGDPGTTLAAPETLLWDKSTGDVAAYTNTYDDSTDTPTGILISNLPYIALALVAIGGLVAYVVVRRRQSDEA